MDDYYCEATRSVSDGESDGERRLRRSRRKRGGGGRYRPYSPSDEMKKKADKSDRYGMAPPNSTQFLLDDREARADAEFENEQKFEAAERRRVRTMSGSYEHMRPAFWCTVEPATSSEFKDEVAEADSSSSSSSSSCGSSDREMEREFETDYLEVKRERIQSMTRSQLAAELLERDQDTQLLARELGTKETENRHLRSLLTAHGISPDEPVTSSTTIPAKSPVIAN
uniref:CUE domain-containing protein n=1 Tax=Caenorhabditis tropicalis TaxID=1561998 RepID=A0A1I7UP85_9PELO